MMGCPRATLGCVTAGPGWNGHFQPCFHPSLILVEQQLSLSPAEAADTVARAWDREPPALGSVAHTGVKAVLEHSQHWAWDEWEQNRP